MNQDVEILMDFNDPDLTGPFYVTIDYYEEDPKENEDVTTMAEAIVYKYDDAEKAFEDWGTILPSKDDVERVRQNYGVIDIFVEISMYDSHNCTIATANFKWEDNE